MFLYIQVRQVACGGMHSLALTEEGTVWTWGEPWGEFHMVVDRSPRPVSDVTHTHAHTQGYIHAHMEAQALMLCECA